MIALITTKNGLRIEARAEHSYWGRLRGLLGSTADASPILMSPCASIHTFGMRYPIDVVLLDGSGRVLASERRVAPGRVVQADKAHYALERPSSIKSWFEEGEQVQITYLITGEGSLLIQAA